MNGTTDADGTRTETWSNHRIIISEVEDTYRVEGRGGQLAAHVVEKVDIATLDEIPLDVHGRTVVEDDGSMLTVTVTDDGQKRRADITLPGGDA